MSVTHGLQEKCVDISLAVEMMHYASVPGAYDCAVLLSGDKDFMPALARIRQQVPMLLLPIHTYIEHLFPGQAGSCNTGHPRLLPDLSAVRGSELPSAQCATAARATSSTLHHTCVTSTRFGLTMSSVSSCTRSLGRVELRRSRSRS